MLNSYFFREIATYTSGLLLFDKCFPTWSWLLIFLMTLTPENESERKFWELTVCKKPIKKRNIALLIKKDSKELSPRSLDKMLQKWQVNSQNVQSTQLSKFFKYSKSSKFFKLYCMLFKQSKLVSIQYDVNCYDSCNSQTCLNMFKHV